MSAVGQVTALGLLGGVGLTLILTGCATTRVDLGRLLARMQTPPSGSVDSGGAQRSGLQRTLLAWLARVNTRVPDVELELIGETRERFGLIRIGFAAGGALFLPVLAIAAIVAGLPLPIVVTAGCSLTGALLGWLIPPSLVRTQAAAARAVFRRALCSYFDLVALERTADRGPVEALEHPATLGGSWVFTRLRTEMDRARRLGQPPWQALRILADQVGIDELDDLGAILTLSQEEGASIVESLAAKAASMRQRLLADDLAHAHEQNRMLELPLSLLGITIVLFLIFPGLYALTTG